MPALKVLCIVGTRPEAIKMAPVIKELTRHPDQVRCTVCSTGQHRQMLDQVFELFRIKPDLDLAAMQHGQTLAQLTSRLFSAIDDVVAAARPDWMLAQGDTTTVMVTALVAYYRRVGFGHVEAGLRTGDPFHPFPEEINRQFADILADALFAPTERNRQTLLREGRPENRIWVTGNTVIDALLEVASLPYDWSAGPLACLPADKRLVLITAHRRESFGDAFRDICLAIRELAESFHSQGFHFVYPVHLNPNVQEPVHGILADVPNVSLMKPLDYLSFVQLMKRATLIMTDSGGVQEEAPGLKIPVVVMRDTTERPEGVESGVVRLAGTTHVGIVQEVGHLLSNPEALARMARGASPYGDGHAAQRIVAVLLEGSPCRSHP
jgi:UDP-N-acetylglucosamine 2-epimerase